WPDEVADERPHVPPGTGRRQHSLTGFDGCDKPGGLIERAFQQRDGVGIRSHDRHLLLAECSLPRRAATRGSGPLLMVPMHPQPLPRPPPPTYHAAAEGVQDWVDVPLVM